VARRNGVLDARQRVSIGQHFLRRRQMVLDVNDSVHMRDCIQHSCQVFGQQRSAELNLAVIRRY
jgi:hypothetical protein